MSGLKLKQSHFLCLDYVIHSIYYRIQPTIREREELMLIRVAITLILFPLLLTAGIAISAENSASIQVARLGDGPIIIPEMDNRMGSNIQGPSLIKVP
jgi:hypothetical protein